MNEDIEQQLPTTKGIEYEPMLSAGFPTHTDDINGERICLGDKVVYDYKGESNSYFIVVFENNAFRKKYPKWNETLIKPLLEFGNEAKIMRLKVAEKACR
jgi:hypothetical protein